MPSSGAQTTSSSRTISGCPDRPSLARAAVKPFACAANSSTRGTGTMSQPSAIRAARAMPAGTCEPTRIGGRGRWIGRGRIVRFSKLQCRPYG